MKCTFLLAGVLIAIAASAQTKQRYTDTVINGKVYHHVDDPPFKGYYHYVEQMPQAQYDIYTYLNNNLRHPTGWEKCTGRIIVRFIVNEDGRISDCKIARGMGGEYDEEALRVIRKMPPWIPGKQNGKPVKVPYVVPVIFKLDTKEGK
ncbi:MAG: energy transducer TonB [Flavipsychrobacter sp.]|jgi:protein TonB|nr:energy transducer TonB [Flavipsychrobacter sp.]